MVLSYIVSLLLLLVGVKGVQHCATGFPPASNGVRLKDSWKPCDTSAVRDGNVDYCMRAFYRHFVSKREAGLSLTGASKKLKTGVASPTKWIHTCDRVAIPYQNDQGQEKVENDALDNIALGVGCDDYETRTSHNVTFCFINEPNVSNHSCPVGRPDITPHVGIWYNAGSESSPLQYQIKLCRCRAFDASHECQHTVIGAHAMRSFDDEFWAARQQENMYVYPMFLPTSDLSFYLLFASGSILTCWAAVLFYCAGYYSVVTYFCKKHRGMRLPFDEIQRVYRPMDDLAIDRTITSSTENQASSVFPTKRKMTTEHA